MRNDNVLSDDDTSQSDFDSDDSVLDKNYEVSRKKSEIFLIENELSDDNTEYSDQQDLPDLPPETFNFSKQTSTPKSFANYLFRETPGPNYPFEESSPLQIFEKTFGVQTLELIVEQSNLYAQQNGKCLDLSVEELKAFLGILIIMGFHTLPTMRLFWCSEKNFRVDRVANIMTQKRFLFILRYLHVNNNELMPKRGEPGYDKLYKI